MKKSFMIQGFVLIGIVMAIAIVGAVRMANEPKKESFEGHIAPEAERNFEWVKDPMFGFVPYKTVEVELLSGDKVIAEISNHHSTPYFVEYKDSPDAKGKRIFVFLDKCEGKYTITAGKIEE